MISAFKSAKAKWKATMKIYIPCTKGLISRSQFYLETLPKPNGIATIMLVESVIESNIF